jgi:hypothetical protein
LRRLLLGFVNWIEIISRRAEGMWESRSDFQGLREVWENSFIVFPCFPQTVISSAL